MSNPLKIIADINILFLEGVLDAYADITYLPGEKIDPDNIRNADALIVRTRTKCDASLLEGSTIKLIATATIGYDHIDLPYCESRGINVVTAAGCNARGVLQYIAGTLAALSESERWSPKEKTLGIIGIGHVGSLIAEYASHWGFRVVCCDPPRMEQETGLNFITQDKLLTESDIVSLHVPLIFQGKYKTLGMGDDIFFQKMNGTTLINSSRGEVIEDVALLRALTIGNVTKVCIDTWNNEPHLNRELLNKSTFATPHIAGYSIQGKAAGTAAVVQAISEAFQLPLSGWYPTQIKPTVPNTHITWEEMKNSITHYFDISAETRRLKNNPEMFEEFRNRYDFRTEYF